MLGVDANEELIFKVSTDDKLITKLMLQCGTSSMVHLNTNFKHGSHSC